MAESSLRELWAELRSDLQALRTEFPDSETGRAPRANFDEFLLANEFGLALETLCDLLLASGESVITAELLAAISHLHAKMGVEDGCVALLQSKGKRPDSVR